MTAPPTREELASFSADPANWRLALFYHCRRDPRVVVPKRQPGFGWTVNFANPWALPFMAAVSLGILGTVDVAQRTGLTTGSGYIALIAVLLGLTIWICHRMTRAPLRADGRPPAVARWLIVVTILGGLLALAWR